MTKHQDLTKQQAAIVCQFFPDKPFDSLTDIPSSPNLEKCLFYPTNDHTLTQVQFELIAQCLNKQECLYALPCPHSGNWYEGSVFCLSPPFSFDEYASLPLDAPTFLFSDSGNWALITDECIEGGTGIFLAAKHVADRFSSVFLHTRADLLRFVDFYLRDGQARTGDYRFLSTIVKSLL